MAKVVQHAPLMETPAGGGTSARGPACLHETQRILHLLLGANLLALGRSAFDLKRLWHDDQAVYTVPVVPVRDAGADLVTEMENPAVRELHVLRGAWSQWTLDEAETLLRDVRQRRPELWVKMFTAEDIVRFARHDGLSYAAVAERLQEAGLDQLSDTRAGGATALTEEGRPCASVPRPCWCTVHEEAHRAGLPTEAVLHFGTAREAPAFARSLAALRALEERSPGALSVLLVPASPWRAAPDWCLRVVAAARLTLETVPHVKVHLPSLSQETAAAALSFGANALDLRPMPWADRADAGVNAALARRLVRHAGQTPVARPGILYVNRIPAPFAAPSRG